MHYVPRICLPRKSDLQDPCRLDEMGHFLPVPIGHWIRTLQFENDLAQRLAGKHPTNPPLLLLFRHQSPLHLDVLRARMEQLRHSAQRFASNKPPRPTTKHLLPPTPLPLVHPPNHHFGIPTLAPFPVPFPRPARDPRPQRPDHHIPIAMQLRLLSHQHSNLLPRLPNPLTNRLSSSPAENLTRYSRPGALQLGD